MATMNTGIQINSMMSQQFNSMNIAMSTVINNFYTFQDVASRAIDVSAIEAVQEELKQVKSNFNQVEQEIRKVGQVQETLNQNIENANNPANKLLGTIGSIAKSYLSLQQLGKVLSLSDDMANSYTRLDMINDGETTTPELQQMIFDTAQSTYTPYQVTADMVAKLGMQEATPFENNAEIVDFVEQVNKSLAISGTPQEDINSVMQQLTQSMTGGVLQEKDLNGIIANAEPIFENIQRYLKEAMNIDVSNIQELASKGIITGEVIKNAMLYATDETNAAFESMPVTWSQLWTNFQNSALMAFQNVLMELNNIANSEKFQSFINGVTQLMNLLGQVTLGVINILASIGGFIYDNWSIVGPIILGVGAALLAFVIALGLVTAATWAWNLALAANPVVWVIVAIVLLISLFYLIIGIINQVAGTSISATGIIAGVFMLLYASIYNAVARVWNAIAAFWEFFANVGQHPIYSIKRLFYNLASNFLDQVIAMIGGWDSFATAFVNAIIWAVNGAIKAWNGFIDLLPEGVASILGLGKGVELEYRESFTSDLQKYRGLLDKLIDEPPTDYWEAPKMEFKDLRGAWDTGYDWGANLFDFGKQEDDSQQKEQEAQMQAIMESLGTGNNFANNTAENTGRFADSVEMAGEDLAYMKDLAEREVINRYTAAEIKVDMRNENHINSELDIDGVINRFGERAEEAADMLAEGGYTYYV